MINKIIVKPRKFIQNLVIDPVTAMDNWGLISIFGKLPNEHSVINNVTIARLKLSNCRSISSILFDDLTDKEVASDNWGDHELFDKEHARKIIFTLDRWNKHSSIDLVVQCNAGISRSGAVGLFACRYLGLDENKFWKMNKGLMPNYFILGVLNEVLGKNV